MAEWATELFSGMRQVAKVLDSNVDVAEYSLAVEHEWQKILNPELTPSAKILDTLLSKNQDNGALGIELAARYKQSLSEEKYQFFDADMLRKHALSSLDAQHQIEQSDIVSFDKFLTDYFTYQFDKF
jgi:glutamate--cysteine ligase